MSSGILSALISTIFNVKSRFSSECSTQAGSPRRPICIIIGFIGMPATGSGLMRPTTGFDALITRETARARSYSSRRSRFGARKGIASFWSSMLALTPR